MTTNSVPRKYDGYTASSTPICSRIAPRIRLYPEILEAPPPLPLKKRTEARCTYLVGMVSKPEPSKCVGCWVASKSLAEPDGWCNVRLHPWEMGIFPIYLDLWSKWNHWEQRHKHSFLPYCCTAALLRFG